MFLISELMGVHSQTPTCACSANPKSSSWVVLPRREPGAPARSERLVHSLSLSSNLSGVIEIFGPKYLNDLCLPLAHDLPKTLAPFDNFVQ